MVGWLAGLLALEDDGPELMHLSVRSHLSYTAAQGLSIAENVNTLVTY